MSTLKYFQARESCKKSCACLVFMGTIKRVPFSRETTLDSIRNNRVRNNRFSLVEEREFLEVSFITIPCSVNTDFFVYSSLTFSFVISSIKHVTNSWYIVNF